MKYSKILATIGPSCDKKNIIKKLVINGVDSFRINFSHGDHKWHSKVIKNVRAVSKELNIPIAILADLQGPKIRTGKLKNSPVHLKDKKELIITTKSISGDSNMISTTFKELPKSLKPGNRILLSDGLIELSIKKITPTKIITKIINGGLLKEYQGINIPDATLKTNALTSKDKIDLKFALKMNVDYVALSFVQKAADIKKLSKIIIQEKSKAKIIAKIEKPQAVSNIDTILDSCDGIMIARGDLGVETCINELPIIQKDLITKAALKRKIVITATQMLESMINNPRPTRAESTDVANAILDGTDATMLSGETACGKYPIKSVQTMNNIAIKAGKSKYSKKFDNSYDNTQINIPLATASAAIFALQESQARAIIVFTTSGRTARIISKLRPNVPIIASTPEIETYRNLSLLWGVIPIYCPYRKNSNTFISDAQIVAKKRKLIKSGDNIIVLFGNTRYKTATNTMQILTIE